MITATGIGSGLDVEGLVGQLMAAERQPTLDRLNTQESILQAELSAYGTVQGALSGLQSAIGDVRQLTTFQKRTVSTTGEGVTASVASNASLGNFSVEVSQLANSHSLASQSYSEPNSIVGTGTLTIRFGTTDYESGTDTYNSFTLNENTSTLALTIDSSNETLEGVRDAINAADAGVSAAIVNDGSGYRLLISSTNTGEQNSLEISVDDDDLIDTDSSGLSSLAFNSAATNLTQTVAAVDASFTMNGLLVTSDSNTVTEVVDGLTMDIRQVTTSPVDLVIEKDIAGVKSSIEQFVNGFRAFNNVVNQLSQFDAESQRGSILLGDATLRSAASQVRQVLIRNVDNLSGSFSTLSELGITTDSFGNLNIDDAKLDAAIEDNFDDLTAFFSVVGTIDDDTINFVGSSSDTEAGLYDISISQHATRGAYIGSSVLPNFGIGQTLVIDTSNDALSLEVNGVSGALFNLTQGTYTTGEELAAEIQARINGVSEFQDAGISVTVTYDSIGNTLSLTSNSYGSDSAVNILTVDGDTASTLGFAVGDGTDGVDVAGTINGQLATGVGQSLTVDADSGPAAGLVVSVTSGALGARGEMTFSRGLIDQLDATITAMLASGGLLDARTTGINNRISTIEDDRTDHLVRMDQVERRLRSEFSSLDALVSRLQSTGSFLTNALASIPQPASG